MQSAATSGGRAPAPGEGEEANTSLACWVGERIRLRRRLAGLLQVFEPFVLALRHENATPLARETRPQEPDQQNRRHRTACKHCLLNVGRKAEKIEHLLIGMEPRIGAARPRELRSDRRCFVLLEQAYVGSRYWSHYPYRRT